MRHVRQWCFHDISQRTVDGARPAAVLARRRPRHPDGPCLPVACGDSMASEIGPLAATMPRGARHALWAAHRQADALGCDALGRIRRGTGRVDRRAVGRIAGIRQLDRCDSPAGSGIPYHAGDPAAVALGGPLFTESDASGHPSSQATAANHDGPIPGRRRSLDGNRPRSAGRAGRRSPATASASRGSRGGGRAQRKSASAQAHVRNAGGHRRGRSRAVRDRLHQAGGAPVRPAGAGRLSRCSAGRRPRR